VLAVFTLFKIINVHDSSKSYSVLKPSSNDAHKKALYQKGLFIDYL